MINYMGMSDQETNKEILEVVDENDNVIGLETRAKIHKEGLASTVRFIFGLLHQAEK